MIPQIQKQRKIYPDPKTVPFLTWKEYDEEAKKYIKMFCTKSAAHRFLCNPDIVSWVTEMLVFADWRFDEKRCLDRKYHRVICAKWAVKELFKKRKKKRDNIDLESMSMCNEIDNKELTPIEKLIQKESETALKNKIKVLLETSQLTESQRNGINAILNGDTFSETGKKLDISKQAVQQSKERALKNIKFVAGK